MNIYRYIYKYVIYYIYKCMLNYKIKMTDYKYLFIFRNILVNKNETPIQNEIKYNTVVLVYI